MFRYLASPLRLGRRALLLMALAGLATGCAHGLRLGTPSLAEAVEAEHNAEAYAARQAVEADLTVEFGGNTMLEGTMRFATDFSGARLDRADGASVIHDGKTAWISPAGADFPQARFHVLTWSYFLAAPMKLADPGTQLTPTGQRLLEADGRAYRTGRLSFGEGVGDAPDDWYEIYVDPETGRLKAMGYIVTYGKGVEEAEQEPHAIVYRNLAWVDGVLFSRQWDFYNWSVESGIEGEPIGRVTLENVRFVEPRPGEFTRPADSFEEPLP